MSRPPTPPRFVPTLTEVIRPMPAPPAVPMNEGETSATTVALQPAVAALTPSADVQEQMVQRVLQRVDLVLERRLREVVGQLILEQTRALTPRLREEIEVVVRQSVSQAFDADAAAPNKTS